MEISDKVCPHCGHGVLSWDIVCPGCSLIPAETPEGKAIERRWRLKNFLLNEWPTLAGVLLVLLLLVLWFLPGPKHASANGHGKPAHEDEGGQ